LHTGADVVYEEFDKAVNAYVPVGTAIDPMFVDLDVEDEVMLLGHEGDEEEAKMASSS
jgi:hypothetical protein